MTVIRQKATIIQRKDTLVNWNNENPILEQGEMGVVWDIKPVMFKIGDGETEWKDLPFFTEGIIHSLPQIEVRFVRHSPGRSTLFPNETNRIQNAHIEFRPLCSDRYFNSIKDGLMIGLQRFKNKTRCYGDIKKKTRGFHIVSKAGKIPATTYPAKTLFTQKEIELAPWTPKYDLSPVLLFELVPGEYKGGWIQFPYDVETIFRRFVYARTGTVQNGFTILPPVDNFNNLVNSASKTIKGYPHDALNNSRHSIVVNLCLCRPFDNEGNVNRWDKGPGKEIRITLMKPNSTEEISLNMIRYIASEATRSTLKQEYIISR